VFGKMPFPLSEFFPAAESPAANERGERGGCCKDNRENRDNR